MKWLKSLRLAETYYVTKGGLYPVIKEDEDNYHFVNDDGVADVVRRYAVGGGLVFELIGESDDEQ